MKHRNWIIQFNETPTGYLPYIDENVDQETEEDYLEFGASVNKIYVAAHGTLTEIAIPELQQMADEAASMPRETREQRIANSDVWKQVEARAFNFCKIISRFL